MTHLSKVFTFTGFYALLAFPAAAALPDYELIPWRQNGTVGGANYAAYKIDRKMGLIYNCIVNVNGTTVVTATCVKAHPDIPLDVGNLQFSVIPHVVSTGPGGVFGAQLWMINPITGVVQICLTAGTACHTLTDR